MAKQVGCRGREVSLQGNSSDPFSSTPIRQCQLNSFCCSFILNGISLKNLEPESIVRVAAFRLRTPRLYRPPIGRTGGLCLPTSFDENVQIGASAERREIAGFGAQNYHYSGTQSGRSIPGPIR